MKINEKTLYSVLFHACSICAFLFFLHVQLKMNISEFGNENDMEMKINKGTVIDIRRSVF